MDDLIGNFPKVASGDQKPFGRKFDPRMGHGEASLRLLGLASSTNRSQLSDATVDQAKAHLNVLHRNGIPITAEYICANPIAILNGLRDKHGRLLSDQYKRQIGITLKRLFPSQMATIREYNQSRSQQPKTRDVDPNFLIAVRKMGEYAAKYLSVVSRMGKVEDLAMYDSCLASVLTMLTSLRIAELHQLTLDHLALIERGELIGIHSKASDAPRAIPLTEALTTVINLIRKQRPLVETAAKELPSNPQTGEYRVISLSRRMVFTSTVGTMRKKLVAVMSQASVANNTDLSAAIKTVGFNPFRNLLVSTLVDGGGHFIAKALNNHSSLNTTIGNYNIITPQAADDAFRSLQEMSANLRLGPLNTNLKVPPGPKIKTEPQPTSKTKTGGQMDVSEDTSSATTSQQQKSQTTKTTPRNRMNLPEDPSSSATSKMQPNLMDLPAGPSSARTSQPQQSEFQAITTTRNQGMTLPAGPELQIVNTGSEMELDPVSPASSDWDDFPEGPLVGEPAQFSTFEFPTVPAPTGQSLVQRPSQSRVQPPGQSFVPPPGQSFVQPPGQSFVQPPGQSFVQPPPPIGNQQTSTIVKPIAQQPAQTTQPQRPSSVQQRVQTPQNMLQPPWVQPRVQTPQNIPRPPSVQQRVQTPQPTRPQSTQTMPRPRVQTPQNIQQPRVQTPQNIQQPRVQTPQNIQQPRVQTPQNIQRSRPSSVQTIQQQGAPAVQSRPQSTQQRAQTPQNNQQSRPSSVQTIQQQGTPAVQSRPQSAQQRVHTPQTIQQRGTPYAQLRPTSALSEPQSRPTSALSRQQTAQSAATSRPQSATTSRPQSATTSRPQSATASRPQSATTSRPPSTQQNSQQILQTPPQPEVIQIQAEDFVFTQPEPQLPARSLKRKFDATMRPMGTSSQSPSTNMWDDFPSNSAKRSRQIVNVSRPSSVNMSSRPPSTNVLRPPSANMPSQSQSRRSLSQTSGRSAFVPISRAPTPQNQDVITQVPIPQFPPRDTRGQSSALLPPPVPTQLEQLQLLAAETAAAQLTRQQEAYMQQERARIQQAELQRQLSNVELARLAAENELKHEQWRFFQQSYLNAAQVEQAASALAESEMKTDIDDEDRMDQ